MGWKCASPLGGDVGDEGWEEVEAEVEVEVAVVAVVEGVGVQVR